MRKTKKIVAEKPKKTKAVKPKGTKKGFKYEVSVSVGDVERFKAETDNITDTLLQTGIDPITIDFWTKITVKEGKKEFSETLNVAKARNLLVNRDFCQMIVDNILYNLNL